MKRTLVTYFLVLGRVVKKINVGKTSFYETLFIPEGSVQDLGEKLRVEKRRKRKSLFITDDSASMFSEVFSLTKSWKFTKMFSKYRFDLKISKKSLFAPAREI